MGDYLFYYLQTYLGFGTVQNAWLVTWWGVTGVTVNWVLLKPRTLTHCLFSLLIVLVLCWLVLSDCDILSIVMTTYCDAPIKSRDELTD
jgi:hypothetical protein